ncbi:MAG: hypothetical protein HQ582_00240, partial [Planctomycetes bacterium]|nr:hypothetical protein [Planctomycetota bacterium]
LVGLINEGHHEVQLSDEELHRIALWIDANCRFFGPTRNLLRQAMGEDVMPEIE